jgi:hypothetical protein
MKWWYYVFVCVCINVSAQSNDLKMTFGGQLSNNVALQEGLIFTPNIFFGLTLSHCLIAVQLEHVGFINGPKNKMIGLHADYRFLKQDKRFSPLIKCKASTSFYSPNKNQLLSSSYHIPTNLDESIGRFQTIPLNLAVQILLDIKTKNWSIQVGSGYGITQLNYLVSNDIYRNKYFHSVQFNLGLNYSFGKLN